MWGVGGFTFEHHLCLPCHYVPITFLITSGGRGSQEEGRHAALFTNQICVPVVRHVISSSGRIRSVPFEYRSTNQWICSPINIKELENHWGQPPCRPRTEGIHLISTCMDLKLLSHATSCQTKSCRLYSTANHSSPQSLQLNSRSSASSVAWPHLFMARP